jgi:hypothetical protein
MALTGTKGGEHSPTLRNLNIKRYWDRQSKNGLVKIIFLAALEREIGMG